MSKRRVGLENNIKFSRKRCKNIQNMIWFFLYFPSLNFHICMSGNFKFFFCASLFYFYTLHTLPIKALFLSSSKQLRLSLKIANLAIFSSPKKSPALLDTSNYSLALVSHFYPTFLNKTKNVVSSKGDSITMAVYIPCPI